MDEGRDPHAAGIADMQIAGSTLAERVCGEAIYYETGSPDAYSIDVARMDSHGGWRATPKTCEWTASLRRGTS
jgi:hypothetical protein